MQLNIGKAYLSNNPCFPGQLFHLKDVKPAKRFGKDNVLVTYDRYAFNHGDMYKVDTETSWLFNARSLPILGEQLPAELEGSFEDELRCAGAERGALNDSTVRHKLVDKDVT